MTNEPRPLRVHDVIEELAAIEHDRWAHWQRYLHSQCIPGPDGSLLIPADLVRRWTAQMNKSYGDLSDVEQESDRQQVERYLPVIERALTVEPN